MAMGFPAAFTVLSLNKEIFSTKKIRGIGSLTNGHSVLQPGDTGGRDPRHVTGQDQGAPRHLAHCLRLGVLERWGHCRSKARCPES